MVEHLNHNQEVEGSNPFVGTIHVDYGVNGSTRVCGSLGLSSSLSSQPKKKGIRFGFLFYSSNVRLELICRLGGLSFFSPNGPYSTC